MRSPSTFFALTILIGAMTLAALACESPLEEPLPTLAPTLTRKPVTATPSKIPATPTKVLTPTATLDPTKYFGVNMIINGDAEMDSGNGVCLLGPKGTLKGWKVESITLAEYGSIVGNPDQNTLRAQNRGKCYFRKSVRGGSPNPLNSIYQTVDVSVASSVIDGGKVKFTLSAFISAINEESSSRLIAAFFDAGGKKIGEAFTPKVDEEDTTNGVALLLTKQEGVIPVGTRKIEIRLQFQSGKCEECESAVYADILSFVMTR